MDLSTTTRAARQNLISRIINSRHVHSQRELSDALATHGVQVTQATLSRDLREMRATKVRAASGDQVYVLPEAGAPGQTRIPDGGENDARTNQRLARLTSELLVSVAYAYSDVVVQTPPGGAQLLAAAIDDAMLPGVLGTIAGDDTILIPTTDTGTADAVATLFVELVRPHRAGPATLDADEAD